MRFPFYRQLDSADCGPSCLRMIAKYYGRPFELYQLRDLCYANKDGVPLLGINDAAEQIGFRCTAVKSSFERFAKKAIFPCIVHWREDHFIVVYKVKVEQKANGEWSGKVVCVRSGFWKDCLYGRRIPEWMDFGSKRWERKRDFFAACAHFSLFPSRWAYRKKQSHQTIVFL